MTHVRVGTHVGVFLPEEETILSYWLGKSLNGKEPSSSAVEHAIEALGLEETHPYEHNAVAAIVLERIQLHLPNSGLVDEDFNVELSRDVRERLVTRTVELMPEHLLTVNWADSGPFCDWPERYHMTWLPLFDVFIVTASGASREPHGSPDRAIGVFATSRGAALEAAENILVAEWEDQCREWEQGRWDCVYNEGLISKRRADALADRVWPRE